jgi:putative nucleotidyltransferase with HDIG domain
MRFPVFTRARASVAFALLGCVASALWAAASSDHKLVSSLCVGLIVIALIANIAAADLDADGKFVAGGSFIASMLAVAFLGPAPAFLVAAVAELGAWAWERYRLSALPINVFASAGPNVAAATAFAEFAPADRGSVGFYVVLASVACLALMLNAFLVATLFGRLNGDPAIPRVQRFAAFAPALLITVALTVAAAATYVRVGFGGGLFVLVSILAYTYMARLVVAAHRRTRQYASLSWGVLSGLLRTLDLRDGRAARHAAGVAAFSRDIAEASGMRPEECELAHTAGLLHDIGRFGLSDRVMERGRTLTEQDWQSIREHPELGYDMLRDLGIYGPVAEIVRAHHERVDGRGYPHGLAREEIPEIARIVAVAESYDTLTADDTYRTPMSSFEALTELRRVSGSQLDERYVEALATLLTGRGVDYRHANTADFDSELDVERRINESVGLDEPPAQEREHAAH